ncbi:uncharacterized protein A4U43_C04F2370 [Asparagus officinalis]|uniref:Uncharacterized protein n=1 Tax=Asparagus officinalis TaxID=4686 RepID=A0A5P1F343_ASPOF|nr:uncharacterized protein A4U43_C04F2370 [Asparagus officinalis]
MVMAALLLFKGLKMVCAAEDLWHVQSTGMPHGWDVAFYVFEFFKGVLFFTVIALIETGWSLLKPYLQASGNIASEMRGFDKLRVSVAGGRDGGECKFDVSCGRVFFNFRPAERNQYLYIGDEEEIEAGEALETD